MSGLDVEGVLREHHPEVAIVDNKPVAWRCSALDWQDDNPSPGGGDGTKFAAHVAAVLREEIAAWLGSEATTDATTTAMADAWIDDSPRELAAAVRAALVAQLAPSRDGLSAGGGEGR